MIFKLAEFCAFWVILFTVWMPDNLTRLTHAKNDIYTCSVLVSCQMVTAICNVTAVDAPGHYKPT